ncbi:hypothetical protein AA313_de0202123 [Arthrobotrys entomopaga]|nr:hypothetical protein AA313_de0202123 [Arthrobotrys entomopaga]
MLIARTGCRSYVMSKARFQFPTCRTFMNPTLVMKTPKYRFNFRREQHPVPTEKPVSSVIVSEFAKANIRCTNEGVKMFEEAYSMSPPAILSDSYELWRRFHDAWMQSGIAFASLSSLHGHSRSPWRSNEQAFSICMDSKVYIMWEALYSSSPVFRGLIDQEEHYAEEFSRRGRKLIESRLWRWMYLLINDGIVNREDIENLPNPVDISKLDVEYI